MNGQKIRDLRKANVLTMQELADNAGVSLQTVYVIEKGYSGARPATIRKLAAALGVDAKELVKAD